MNQIVTMEKKVLSENDRLAAEIRDRVRQARVRCLNLVSSPGSGKTSLLERTLSALKDEIRIGIIAGDVQTENDANRLIAVGGGLVRPIVTGGACHLDARMVQEALGEFTLKELQLLIIENVGNLVCPAAFDLGEAHKVVVLSVTEGEDKPLKYPQMFHAADIMLLNKVDLLPYLDFDLEKCLSMARRVNPGIRIFQLSAKSGAGMAAWYAWLQGER